MTASAKTDIQIDTLLVGIAASPGIAIGETFLLNRARLGAVERHVDAAEVASEIDLFRQAMELSRQQLQEVKQAVRDRELLEHLYIIDTHLLILEDQMLIGDTEALIEQERLNAEGALNRTLAKFRAVFDAIDDEYLRERRSDIDSVGERLLRNLKGVVPQSLAGLERNVVVVAHDLSPADTMQIDKSRVIAFVTDVGGRTSHTAILARSLGIPAVVGLESVTAVLDSGVPIIVDGDSGTLVVNPSPESFREYLKKKQAYEYFERELLSYRTLPAQTLDGHRLALRANLELADDLPQAQAQGAEGIGLFRTEFLFLGGAPPDEEEQLAIYRRFVAAMAPHPVTIRTLDVGGDKFVPEINLADEANPAMGLRAIRFSLKERRLFKIQLRAVLRASAYGRVQVMFPMISGVAEIRACRECIEEARAELVAEGIPFDERMPVGIMIETPSAALIAGLLAREVDFFSVGTNDLIQYCLAVDRGNEHVAYLYEPLHPAVLRALQMVCGAAREAGIGVSMCGEMAGEPLYSLVLLGLGFSELSMNAAGIPRVKRILRQVNRADGERLLEDLLRFPTAREVSRHLEAEMVRRFPDQFGRSPL